jgi:chromosomal replication initiator protein
VNRWYIRALGRPRPSLANRPIDPPQRSRFQLSEHVELSPAWSQVTAELRRVVGDSTYDIWLARLRVKAWDGDSLVLEAPSETASWVRKRFGRIVERSARAALGSSVRISFSTVRDRQRSALAALEAPLETNVSDELNPRYTFDQFIIGDANRLAHGAALVVAEYPGQAFNPLFLHAPPGLGKTHLLHAIGNYVAMFGGGTTVRCTTIETFTNNFISALQARSLDRFKSAYRHADVLLIDDVQFLASKAKTEEEFFHTFNALYDSGRQLVLTCDRLPHQLVGLEERLRERFESGLVAQIEPPDFATRVAILRKRAALDRVPVVHNSVLELIAEQITDNVRALEGALIRIVAYHSLTGRPIDLELAATALGAKPTHRSALDIAEIQSTVASYYEIPAGQLTSSSRAAHIAWPRQVAIHLTRELTHFSLHEIGTAFGGRNHATVLHACKRVSERIVNDVELAGELHELETTLRSRQADRTC